MALINCTECGCVLSEYADKCPKCGCPTKIILENIQKKRVADTQALDNVTNEQTTPKTSSVVIEYRNKQKKSVVPSFLRNRWVIVLGILILCGIWLIAIITKHSIADVSIDKVTPELKSAVQKYDELENFREGLAAVCKNGKWGFIDKLGKEIISCKYDEVGGFKFGVCVVESNEKAGIVDKYGKSLTPIKYDWIECFSLSRDSLTRARLNDNRGILNIEGKVIIPFEYEEIVDFSEGRVLARKDGKYGCIDISNQIVIPFEYEEIYAFSEGIALAKKDGKYGCIDISNQIVIPFEYEGAGIGNGFSEGLIALEKDGSYGYLDKQGNVVIPFDERNSGSPFSSGFATIKERGIRIVSKNNELYSFEVPFIALIDRTGRQVSDFYDGEYEDFRNGYSVVTSGVNRKKGLIDCHGNMVIPTQYWLIASSWIKDGLVCVMDDPYRVGFVNLRTGELAIPCEYDAVDGFAFSDGLWAARKNGKCGFINMSNHEVIPFIYDYVSDFYEGFSVVKKYGKYGYVDRYGTDTFN